MKYRFSRWNVKQIKRDDEIEKILKNNPFMYHKKKYVISSRFNDGNIKDQDSINNELLLFQDENNKQINTLKNKINRKSFLIQENANNYINYMIKEKNNTNKNYTNEPANKNNKNNRYTKLYKSVDQSFTAKNYELNNNLLFSNYTKDTLGKKINADNNINRYNSIGNINSMNKAFSFDENNFLPRITSDITNNNYYDKITRKLKKQFNKNYLDYNQSIMNNRKSPNNSFKMPYIKNNNELTLPPGGISNPNYYNLGESKLSSNPIVNPGNRNVIFNHLKNHKLKSEFVF